MILRSASASPFVRKVRIAIARVQGWIDRQAGKVERVLDALETAPLALTPTPDVGQIALACVLGYRDFRFGGGWRKEYPRLLAWHDAFAAQVPAFAATAPTG